MFRLMVELPPGTGRQREILGLLRPIVEPARHQPGCVACHLCKGVNGEAMIFFTSTWRERADLDRHLRSDCFRLVLAAMDLCRWAPRIEIDDVREQRGLDYIAEVRLEENRAARRKVREA